MPNIIEENQEQTVYMPIPQHANIEDLIGNEPSWLLRSGMGLIGMLLVGVISISWFVKYPDTFVVPVEVTSNYPPLPIVMATSGETEEIYVKQGDMVIKNQTLLRLRSKMDIKEVEMFENWLDQNQMLSKNLIPDFGNLIELQTGINTIKAIQQEYAVLLNNTETKQRIHFAGKENKQLSLMKMNLQEQLQSLKNEYQLLKSDLDRNVQLHEDRYVSTKTLEEVEMRVTQQERQIHQLKSAILNNENQSIQINKQILEWQIVENNQHQTLKNRWEQVINENTEAIKKWKINTIVTAPKGGIFNQSSNLNIGEFVSSNSTLGYIAEPINENSKLKKYFLCQVPMEAMGKIEKGNHAKVQLTAYAKEEYGMIETKITDINRLPNLDKDGNSLYEVKLSIGDKLLTNSKKEIPFQYFMTGQAQLITKEKRLLERFFDKIFNKINDTF